MKRNLKNHKRLKRCQKRSCLFPDVYQSQMFTIALELPQLTGLEMVLVQGSSDLLDVLTTSGVNARHDSHVLYSKTHR